MKKVAIIGCGWLGKALAESLIAQGHHVRGSVTSKDSLALLQNMGVEPFLIKLNNEVIIGNLNLFVEGVDILGVISWVAHPMGVDIDESCEGSVDVYIPAIGGSRERVHHCTLTNEGQEKLRPERRC